MFIVYALPSVFAVHVAMGLVRVGGGQNSAWRLASLSVLQQIVVGYDFLGKN